MKYKVSIWCIIILLFYGIRFMTKLHVYNVEIKEEFSN